MKHQWVVVVLAHKYTCVGRVIVTITIGPNSSNCLSSSYPRRNGNEIVSYIFIKYTRCSRPRTTYSRRRRNFSLKWAKKENKFDSTTMRWKEISIYEYTEYKDRTSRQYQKEEKNYHQDALSNEYERRAVWGRGRYKTSTLFTNCY